MDQMKTMQRTEVIIDGVSAFLAQDEDVDRLLTRIEAAANGRAAFVDFVVVGNRRLRVLVGPGSRVTVATSAVRYDPRDNGDETFPWGGHFDVDSPLL